MAALCTRTKRLHCSPQPSQKLEVDYTGDSESPSGSSSSSSTNVLVATQSVAARGGLQAHDLVVRASGAGGGGGGGAVADVAVSGLPGWVAVWAPRAKTDVRCVRGAEGEGHGSKDGAGEVQSLHHWVEGLNGKHLNLSCTSILVKMLYVFGRVCLVAKLRFQLFNTRPYPRRLRVWAPRGVEVMLRTPLPLPPPPALLRAWRGETAAAGGGAAADDETPAALDEWAGALARKWAAVLI